MFLTDKIIDRQDFARNLFNRSYSFAIFALDYSIYSVNDTFTLLQSCSVAISV